MNNFKKIFLLINFLLIISSSNSFAEFKYYNDSSTFSDFDINLKKNEIVKYYNSNSVDESINESKENNSFNQQIIEENELNIKESIKTESNNKINKKNDPIQNQNFIQISSFIGADFINTNLKFREIDDKKVYPYNSPDSKNNFGLKYLLNISYNKFYLSPEIFYENTKTKSQFSYNRFLNFENNQFIDLRHAFGYKYIKINKRYGGKIKFGYDFNNGFSPYFFTGLSYLDYSNLVTPYSLIQRNQILQNYNYDIFQIQKGRKLVPFYGYGFKIKITDSLYFNTEYHILSLTVNTKAKRFLPYESIDNNKNSRFINLNNSLRIFKTGLLLKF